MNTETILVDVTVGAPNRDKWTFTAVDTGRPSTSDSDRYYVQVWRRDPDATPHIDDSLIYVQSFHHRESVGGYIGRRVAEIVDELTDLEESSV